MLLTRPTAHRPRWEGVAVQPHPWPTRPTADERTRQVAGWHVGIPAELSKTDGVVTFTAAELETAHSRAGHAVGFHLAMTAPLPPAPRVTINVPPYRGKSLIPLLGWLAAHKLTDWNGEIAWRLDKGQGPNSVHKLLESHGWSLDRDRRGRTVCLRGSPPTHPKLPKTRSFVADLGKQQVTLVADYGVFSPDRIDEGTALLLKVAMRHPPVETVADIGVGYGPLAIGLVLNGVARTAVGTDVDCLALWLARQNATALDVPLTLACSPDPLAAQATPLTVSNIPTHLSAANTLPLMDGLARRADHGTLLAVVHASLETRYTRHLTAAGLRVDRHPGSDHVVLQAARRER